MKNPYDILGVPATASNDELKRAYRLLARKYHPDTNPNDKTAEDRFKEISAAYELLTDPKGRARVDAARARGNAQRQARNGTAQGYDSKAQYSGKPFGFSGESVEEIFAEMLRRKAKGQAQNREKTADSGANKSQSNPNRGADIRLKLNITFTDAAMGATKRVTILGDKVLDVRIPPASQSGQVLRLKEQGSPGIGGDGDVLVELNVAPHNFFTRNGKDVLLDLPVTVQEAVLGAKVVVPTLHGSVAVKIPPHSNSGGTLRLKEKGIPAKDGTGDQLVTLRVVLPEDAEFRRLVEKWAAGHSYNPRQKLGV